MGFNSSAGVLCYAGRGADYDGGDAMKSRWQETWDHSRKLLDEFSAQVAKYHEASGGLPPDREACLNAWAAVRKENVVKKQQQNCGTKPKRPGLICSTNERLKMKASIKKSLERMVTRLEEIQVEVENLLNEQQEFTDTLPAESEKADAANELAAGLEDLTGYVEQTLDAFSEVLEG